MIRSISCSAFAVLLALPAMGQTSTQATLPYSPSLDVTSMDKTIDPCVDFYTYSCGGWQKKNPIPADQTSWDVYAKLYQDNLKFLRGILEEAAATKTGRNKVDTGDRRFLRRLHGRDGRQPARRPCHSAATGCDRGDSFRPGYCAADGACHFAIRANAPLRSRFAQDPDNSEQVIADLDQEASASRIEAITPRKTISRRRFARDICKHVQAVFQLLATRRTPRRKTPIR